MKNDPVVAGGRLVFSGDLTAFAEQPQFDEGEALLRELATAVGTPSSAIAGNHDYWSGFYAVVPPAQPWFFRKRNRRPDDIFGHRDYVSELGGIGHDFSLRLVTLNSDSEVWGDDKEDGWRRLFAQGACVRDIERAGSALVEKPPSVKTLTVLLMHHSPHYRWREHLMLHEIEPLTVRVLSDFLKDHEIPVVLTGHIHEHALLVDLGDRSDYYGLSSVEARCGTTTQKRPMRRETDALPWRRSVAERLHPRIAALFEADAAHSSKITKPREAPPRPDNVLLVHRILYRAGEEGNEEVFWTTELYWFDGANFRPAPESNGVDEDPLHWRKGNGTAAPPQFRRCVQIWPRVSARHR